MAKYEMREMSDGAKVLPAFTTIKRLIEQLGKSQPWLRIPVQDVIDLVGPDHVAIDPVVDKSAWRWTVGDLSEYSSRYERQVEESL